MTKLLYLDETYKFEEAGEVRSVARDERGGYVLFDATIFYPQGGGQPADKGYLKINDADIPVSFVGFHDGEVRHYIPDAFFSEALVGAHAAMAVNVVARLDNARRHTGGHLISHVLETIDDNLIPIKGYHFPEGSYVEFVNDRNVDVVGLVSRANELLANDVAISHDVSASLTDFPTIAALRPQLAPFTPKDKPSRVVTIGSYRGLPCGGTHVGNLSQLGSIRITKVKKQKGNARVSYEMSASQRVG